MTAYVRPGTKEEVGVITDFVDPEYARLHLLHFALTDGLPPESWHLSRGSSTPTWTSLMSRHFASTPAAISMSTFKPSHKYVAYALPTSASWTKAGYPSSFAIGTNSRPGCGVLTDDYSQRARLRIRTTTSILPQSSLFILRFVFAMTNLRFYFDIVHPYFYLPTAI